MKKWLYLILVFSIYSCCPGGIKTIESGPLPESALKFVPYKNDSIYSLQHSSGLVIQFHTSRDTHEDMSNCADCCYENIFETNLTIMLPDQPIFVIKFDINNLDSIHLNCYVSIGKYGFNIPTDTIQYPSFDMIDSLLIDSISYKSVYLMGQPEEPYTNNDIIKVDSLFYNYKYGILKILMSNGEYYQVFH